MSLKYVLQTAFVFVFIYFSGCQEHPSESDKSVFPEASRQNIDAKQLAAAFDQVRTIGDLQGIAVARNGIIVAEAYFRDAGPNPDPALHVMSVTKSISATLIGIAIDHGFIDSVNTTLGEYLGMEILVANEPLSKVTIKHLLMMTCGHNWYELGEFSEYSAFTGASDQLIYIFNKPLIHTPGTIFNYSDGAAHLISAVIQLATGMSTSEFANQYLFIPMGIGERIWYTDNREIPYGGTSLCLGIDDMIKIGYLYLNEGMYDGERIVSTEWIHEATGFHISTHNIIPFLSDYGYFWWLGSAHGHDFILANGYGGQFIFIVRDLNLVVCTRTNYRNISRDKAGENWRSILNIIINSIVPAVRPMD